MNGVNLIKVYYFLVLDTHRIRSHPCKKRIKKQVDSAACALHTPSKQDLFITPTLADKRWNLYKHVLGPLVKQHLPDLFLQLQDNPDRERLLLKAIFDPFDNSVYRGTLLKK